MTATVSTRLDHLGVVAHDVDRLVALYRKLGFSVSDPVELKNGAASLGQDSAHFVFNDTYVELTAPHADVADQHLQPYLQRHEGLHLVGFDQGGAEEAALYYQQSDLGHVDVQESDRDTGHGIAKFKWFKLPDAFCDGAFSFSVEHVTPELVFHADATKHQNQATALISATMVVDDMDEAFGQFGKLPGVDLRTFAIGRIVVMGDQRLIFVEPSGFEALFANVDLHETPYCAAMAIRTNSLAAVKSLLKENGVPCQPWGDRAVWVHPDYTGGPVLQFMDADERRDTPRFMPGRPGRAPQPIGEGFLTPDDGHD